MEFLNPAALFALAAVAIPLIVHLFHFRRPRKVDFSSLAFVKELRKSTVRRVRVKQWLLLALRLLAIASVGVGLRSPDAHEQGRRSRWGHGPVLGGDRRR